MTTNPEPFRSVPAWLARKISDGTQPDHSRDRVEAAAKALTEVLELPEFMATDVRDADWLRRDASLILAAADDCDRVAGVIRVDTNDAGVAEQIAMILHHYEYHGEPGAAAKCWAADDAAIDSHNVYREQASYLLGALSVLGAAGVGEQQGEQT